MQHVIVRHLKEIKSRIKEYSFSTMFPYFSVCSNTEIITSTCIHNNYLIEVNSH